MLSLDTVAVRVPTWLVMYLAYLLVMSHSSKRGSCSQLFKTPSGRVKVQVGSAQSKGSHRPIEQYLTSSLSKRRPRCLQLTDVRYGTHSYS